MSGLRMTEDQVAEHVCRVRGGIRHESSAACEYGGVTALPTEHDEQVAFVAWFRLRYPGTLIFAIPNGQERHMLVAKKLCAEGVLPGVPDLFIPEWKLWIEMKRQKGGRVSEEQEKMIEYLEEAGYTVLVCKGCEDAIRKVGEVRRFIWL